MQNAILNEKRLAEAQAGWAAPTPPSPGGQVWAAAERPPAGAPTAPITDGPVSTWRGAMTVSGTIAKTSMLFVLLLAAAVAGWQATPEPEVDSADGTIQYSFPGVALIGVVIGFVAVIALMFRPQWPSTSPRSTPSGRGSPSGRSRPTTRRSSTASSSRPPVPRSACSP